MERHWNYKEEEGGGGPQNPNYLKNSMKGVGEGKIKKKTTVEMVWTFSGTIQWVVMIIVVRC